MKFIEIQSNDLRVCVLEYGARLCHVQYKGVDMALGYPKETDYLNDVSCMGASVGPIANRIANAQIEVNGERFTLPRNEGLNCLHSGGLGTDGLPWALGQHTSDRVVFDLAYDLKQIGMKGNLHLQAVYTVNGPALTVAYTAQCDTETFINLTNHVYLNLSGAWPAEHPAQSPCLTDHQFELMGRRLLLTDEQSIPTGEAFEFTEPLRYRLNDAEVLNGQFLHGVDNHIEVKDNDDELADMLQATSKSTGIGLRVSSNSPGYQFYTGQFLGAPFAPSMGFCVETQYAPNAINDQRLYSPLLKAHEARTHTTVFEFTTSEIESST